MLKKSLLFVLLNLLCAVPLLASERDKPDCEKNPLFSPFSGEYINKCDRAPYGTLDVRRWKVTNNPKSGSELFKTEGQYWFYNNGIAMNRKAGKLEVQRNFENAVREVGGTVLFVDGDGGRVSYRIPREDGDFYGQSGCGNSSAAICNSITHKIIKIAPVVQSVVVTADQIATSVFEDGKVVFYGIYFDIDKATLKKESAPTLKEIAVWLKNNPTTKVFIVGHTDMQGSKEHNIGLSKARGEAVVDELVAKYGIARSRLTPEGVGPLAPVATNYKDAGRAKNRRVEMVLQ